jgi:hypothetical protein
MIQLSSVCVFCGSSLGSDPLYAAAARRMGELLAMQGITVVFGGGGVGLMGQVADAALAAGGKVIGVIPELLVRKELGHAALTQLRVVQTMHERKQLMADLSDGFMALPGGFGTFEEFCEILTWAQLGLHAKPCGLLNVNGYYDKLLEMIDHAVQEQFVHPRYRTLVTTAGDPERLLEEMRRYRAPVVEKWLTPQAI